MKTTITTMSDESLAFEIVELNLDDGICVVAIKKGILGALSNQLKGTDDRRKGANIIRTMGFKFAKAGDILYKKNPDKSVSKNTID